MRPKFTHDDKICLIRKNVNLKLLTSESRLLVQSTLSSDGDFMASNIC